MPLTGPPLEQPVDLPTLLRTGVGADPDAAALVSSAGRWSWRDLDAISGRLAAGLLGLGLRPGDRVASLMPNRRALLAHYLACFKAGLVATPLNYRYRPPEIDHALQVSGAAALLAHAERDADVRALATPLPRVIRYGGGDGLTFEAMTAPALPVRDLPPPDPAAPAAVFFTSGSTGRPKGVTHTGETFGWMLASVRTALRYTANDVVLPGSSHSHLGGMLFAFAALSVGARVLIPRTMDGDELLTLFRQERPTVLWMLPAALFRLAREHGASHYDFVSLRVCVSGGDTVPDELEREFSHLTDRLIAEGYGMTEVGHAASNPVDGGVRVGSVGRLTPGYALSIRDEGGAEVAAGGEGRLWLRSRGVTVGYWDNPTATAEAIRDGWLDTGDVMRVDGDGYLWFRGRRKQIIVHDGSNICPQEVEAALVAHPAVAAAAVVGVQDLVHGENVVAYVTLLPGAARPSEQELIRFARERVGYKAPEVVEVLDEMPLNASGKTDRLALKGRAETRGAVGDLGSP